MSGDRQIESLLARCRDHRARARLHIRQGNESEARRHVTHAERLLDVIRGARICQAVREAAKLPFQPVA